MQAVIDFLIANKLVIVTFLFFVSEALSLIPSISANGVFQMIFGWVKKAKDALAPAV